MSQGASPVWTALGLRHIVEIICADCGKVCEAETAISSQIGRKPQNRPEPGVTPEEDVDEYVAHLTQTWLVQYEKGDVGLSLVCKHCKWQTKERIIFERIT